MFQTLADVLGVQPSVVIGAITLLAFAVIQYQRTLSWREYRQYHRLKKRVLPWLAYVWTHAIHEKGGTDDPEYIATWSCTLKQAYDTLSKAGLEPNLLSSLKRRPDGLSDLHMVEYHDDGTQTEVYAFTAGANSRADSVDVYTHHETATTDPKGHLTDEQRNGDPRDVLDGIAPE